MRVFLHPMVKTQNKGRWDLHRTPTFAPSSDSNKAWRHDVFPGRDSFIARRIMAEETA